MSWHTGTEDGYVELLGTLLDLATNSAVATVAVNAGGSGYAVGDVLTINGGTTVNSLTAAVEVLTDVLRQLGGHLIGKIQVDQDDVGRFLAQRFKESGLAVVDISHFKTLTIGEYRRQTLAEETVPMDDPQMYRTPHDDSNEQGKESSEGVSLV